MDKNRFLTDFAEQFDETDVVEFKEDTLFKDLEEWSSMIALMIIAMVDENYGKKITGKELRESDTIGELYQKIANK